MIHFPFSLDVEYNSVYSHRWLITKQNHERELILSHSMSGPMIICGGVAVLAVIGIVVSWRIWSNMQKADRKKREYSSFAHEVQGYRTEREFRNFTHQARGYQLDSRYKHDHLKHMHSRTRESAEAGYHVPRNNHDHLKYMHLSQESAEAEVRRMKETGFEGSERLNAYLNSEHGGWYVGKSW
jgi:hypothetical protein